MTPHMQVSSYPAVILPGTSTVFTPAYMHPALTMFEYSESLEIKWDTCHVQIYPPKQRTFVEVICKRCIARGMWAGEQLCQ